MHNEFSLFFQDISLLGLSSVIQLSVDLFRLWLLSSTSCTYCKTASELLFMQIDFQLCACSELCTIIGACVCLLINL